MNSRRIAVQGATSFTFGTKRVHFGRIRLRVIQSVLMARVVIDSWGSRS